MAEQIIVTDGNGNQHVVCEGNPGTGEIIYEPGKRNMLRLCLVVNQAVTLRRDDRLTILRWTGDEFVATMQVA